MVKDHLAESLKLFDSGFNCAQSVVSVFAEEHGTDPELMLRIASPFGGGYGGSGNTCGALTAAFMVIGARYGRGDGTINLLPSEADEMVNRLISVFKKRHGTLLCSELTGQFKQEGGDDESFRGLASVKGFCRQYIETVVIFLEEEL